MVVSQIESKKQTYRESQNDKNSCWISQPSDSDNRQGQTTDTEGCPDVQEDKYRQ